jgi:hypothetical protein
MPELPNQERMEIPLLCSILRRGGTITFSRDGIDLEDELAELYELTLDQREEMLDNPKARRWRNHLQWATRHALPRQDRHAHVASRAPVSSQGRARTHRYLLKAVTRMPADEVVDLLLSAGQFNRFILRSIAFVDD